MSRSHLLRTSGMEQLHFLCCKHNFSAKSAVSCFVLFWSTLLLLFKYKSSDTFKLSRQRRFTFNILKLSKQTRSLYITHTRTHSLSIVLFTFCSSIRNMTQFVAMNENAAKKTNKQTNWATMVNKITKHSNRKFLLYEFGKCERIYSV